MDALDEKIREARELEAHGEAARAYYRWMDAGVEAAAFLAAEHFFTTAPADALPRETVDAAVKLSLLALERAAALLGAVLDLSPEAARAAAGSERMAPLDRRIAAIGWSRPSEVIEYESLDAARGYGKEDLSRLDARLALPLIPVSTLCVGMCRQMYDLQLGVQRLSDLLSADAKQRGNALFLRALSDVIRGRMARAAGAKAAIGATLLRVDAKWRLVDQHAADVARQLCLVHFRLFSRVPAAELRCALPGPPASGPTPLAALHGLESYVVQWTQYEVLRYNKTEDRASVYGLLVRTARQLLDLGAIATARLLLAGIEAPAVARLAETLALVPARTHALRDGLAVVFGPARNGAQLRAAHASRRGLPCIPYVAQASSAPDVSPEDIRIWQRSAYGTLIRPAYALQHYILSQPFRWDPELWALSVAREAAAEGAVRAAYGMRDDDGRLTAAEIAAISAPHNDEFDVIRQALAAPISPSAAAHVEESLC